MVTGSQNDKVSLKTAGTDSDGKGITDVHMFCCTKQEFEVARPGKLAITVRAVMGFCDGKCGLKYLPS